MECQGRNRDQLRDQRGHPGQGECQLGLGWLRVEVGRLGICFKNKACRTW